MRNPQINVSGKRPESIWCVIRLRILLESPYHSTLYYVNEVSVALNILDNTFNMVASTYKHVKYVQIVSVFGFLICDLNNHTAQFS